MTQDGKLRINKGNWDAGGDAGWLDFNNFDFNIAGFNTTPEDSLSTTYWPVEIEYDMWGHPYFTVDEDRDYKYLYVKK